MHKVGARAKHALAPEGLGAQQQRVGAVQHCVGHVRRLGPRRAQRLSHGVHQARDQAGLAHQVAGLPPDKACEVWLKGVSR
jgi:hypothetical protein